MSNLGVGLKQELSKTQGTIAIFLIRPCGMVLSVLCDAVDRSQESILFILI